MCDCLVLYMETCMWKDKCIAFNYCGLTSQETLDCVTSQSPQIILAQDRLKTLLASLHLDL